MGNDQKQRKRQRNTFLIFPETQRQANGNCEFVKTNCKYKEGHLKRRIHVCLVDRFEEISRRMHADRRINEYQKEGKNESENQIGNWSRNLCSFWFEYIDIELQKICLNQCTQTRKRPEGRRQTDIWFYVHCIYTNVFLFFISKNLVRHHRKSRSGDGKVKYLYLYFAYLSSMWWQINKDTKKWIRKSKMWIDVDTVTYENTWTTSTDICMFEQAFLQVNRQTLIEHTRDRQLKQTARVLIWRFSIVMTELGT